MNDSLKASLVAAGRVLLALMFVLSGFSKLTGVQAAAGYIASVGLPAPTALAVLSGLLELVAGIALVIGYKTHWAAFALGLFTLAASVLFHAYWAAPADQQFMQQLLFMKNLAVAGGMFIVAVQGAGALSVDARRSHAASASPRHA